MQDYLIGHLVSLQYAVSPEVILWTPYTVVPSHPAAFDCFAIIYSFCAIIRFFLSTCKHVHVGEVTTLPLVWYIPSSVRPPLVWKLKVFYWCFSVFWVLILCLCDIIASIWWDSGPLSLQYTLHHRLLLICQCMPIMLIAWASVLYILLVLMLPPVLIDKYHLPISVPL